MTRELSLYFASLTARDSWVLLLGALLTFLGIRSFNHKKYQKKFESQWVKKFGTDEALIFPSARAGLYSLLHAHGVGSGDEVIVTGFTCDAVPDAVLHAGAVPVYVDIDLETYGTDPDIVLHLINERTKVLLIQHTYGVAAKIERLIDIGRSNSLLIIEDACLATGVNVDDIPLGRFGDAAIFSFELSKTLSAGWGGIVQINNPSSVPTIKLIRDQLGYLTSTESARRLLQTGLSYWLYHPSLIKLSKYFLALLFKLKLFRYSGSSSDNNFNLDSRSLGLPSDFTWRVLSRQLNELDETILSSKNIADKYCDVLEQHNWAVGLLSREQLTSGLIRFPMLIKNPGTFSEFFKENNIEIGRWFTYPIAPQPKDPNSYNYKVGDCPVAETVSNHIVNLPLHRRMSSCDVAKVCATLQDYIEKYPEERLFLNGLTDSLIDKNNR